MANQEQLDLLKQGAKVWNKWRYEDDNRLIRPDLSNVDLSEWNIGEADLFWANCSMTNFSGANLDKAFIRESYLGLTNCKGASLKGADLFASYLASADFSDADLTEANLGRAMLCNSNFNRANLTRAILGQANLIGTNFSEANFNSADIRGAILNNASLSRANLTGCLIYGSSSWNVDLAGAIQSNLVITSENEPIITVDNLDVAQFIYLLLNNQKIRDVINTIGQNGVLILGRFSNERKLVLDAIREKLRSLNFLPIVFDFERSTERDFTETIFTLAGLSCFIIADITNPKSSPLEMQATIPNYMIPFVPIIQEGEQPFSMFRDLKGKYDWVLDILVYDTSSNLIKGLEKAVVKPALEKRDELLSRKVEQIRMRHIEEYL